MRMQTDIDADSVRQELKHVLFVEGGDSEDSIDPVILGELLKDDKIDIKPLGRASDIKSAAQSLFKHHKNYYFLIDRDHSDESIVDESWNNFPNPDTHNLLIWRRREIENYFIDLDYLCLSDFINGTKEELEKKILDIANERLFLDIANHVIISIREELKNNWIKKFTDYSEFTDSKKSLDKLLNAKEFNEHPRTVNDKVSDNSIKEKFNEFHDKISKKRDKVEFGHGQWMNLMKGKNIFSTIINSNCFKVEDIDGKALQGKNKSHQIVKDLLRKDDNRQPKDFIELKGIIKNIMTE